MTGREQMLAKIVGASVGVLTLYQTTQWLIVQPFRAVTHDLARARAVRQSLELMSRRESRAADDWRSRVERTLSADPVQAANLFRRDVEGLLKAHHLDRDGVVQSNAPRTAKNGLIEVPLAVTAKGRLADVVGFLRDFYRRPYLTQVSRLMLNAGDAKPKDNPGARSAHRDKAASDLISIELAVVTLVLPARPDIRATPIGSLESLAERVDDGRLARADTGEYDRILAANIFGWPAPPVIARADPPPATQDARIDDSPRIERKKPDPPRPREKVVVCGVASMHGEYEAYVRSEGKNLEPPRTYRLRDEFDGGRIVLIHPLGLVVRRPANGEAGAPRDVFYPLGMSSEDREREKPTLPAEVADDLKIALGTGE